MRNLRRALSMALASIMLMGTMAIGVSAKSYTDAADITNTDAVTVVTALEVMIGRDTGDFDPTAVVTRAEMATILCRTVYGVDYQADGYEGITTFTDVAGHWAEGEIGMAFSQGWINGKSAEMFDPNATVQAYEAYVMLQRALGYYDSADSTEYSLGTYAMTLASRLGMSADISTGAYAGLTRENVATAVYNTLFDCAKVAYSSWTGIYYAIDTDGDASITNPNVSVDFGATGTFAADVHDVTIEAGTDLMGRPVKDVIVDKDTLATTAVDHTAIFVDASELSDVTKNMEVAATDSTNLLLNGTAVDLDEVFDAEDEIIAGIVIEVYDDYNTDGEKTGEDTTYVAYTYSYGEITKIEYDEDEDTTDIRISSKTYTLEGETDFAKGDTVMFTAAGSDMETISDVITVEGEVTGVATSFVKLDGTTYTYVGTSLLSANQLGDTYALYLTPYNYVLGVEEIEDSGVSANYLYVSAAEESFGAVKAKVVLADGTTAIVDISQVDGDDCESINDSADGALIFDAAAPVDSVYSYKLDSNGAYKLTTADGTAATAGAFITNGYISTVDEDGKRVSGFLIFDDETLFVDVENGATYIGYEAVPSYTAFSSGNLFYVDNVVFMIGGDQDDSEVGIYVYLLSDDAYTTKLDSTTYTVYTEAYLNGALVSGGLYSEVSTLSAGNLYEVEMDTDGYVTKLVDTVDLTVTADDEVRTVGSYTVHTVGGNRYTYDNDTVFVLIDAIDETVEIASASDLMEQDDDNDDMTQIVIVSEDDGYLELVYILLSEKAVID